jgi:magnesium transporter
MPELKWKYGYPAFWGALLVILVIMLWFFRRQGWLGKDADDESEDGPGA